MFVKRGILSVMAIVTSLHSYGAINRTKNGTVSATAGTALSLSDYVAPYLGSIALPMASNIPGSNGLQLYGDNTVRYGNYVTWITPPSRGNIVINGIPNAAIQIGISTPSYYLTNANGKTMNLGMYLYLPNTQTVATYAGGTHYTTPLDATGKRQFHIGAWYTVARTQNVGTYSNTFTITVTYA